MDVADDLDLVCIGFSATYWYDCVFASVKDTKRTVGYRIYNLSKTFIDWPVEIIPCLFNYIAFKDPITSLIRKAGKLPDGVGVNTYQALKSSIFSDLLN